jgi:hypothetical protein
MTEAREIREKLRAIAETGKAAPFRIGEVTKVSDTDCSVMIGELEITGVKLFSIIDQGGLLVKPKKGSMVTMVDLSNGLLRDLVVVKTDHAGKILYEENGLTVEIDSVSKKVDISNSSISLTKLMTSVYDIISKLTVSTPNGPSGTPLPPTITALEKFKTDFQQLLK